MEESKISQQPENEPLYQQGPFPSVITTDDLVFELGKDVVDRLNKEKLLNSLLKKTKAAEAQAAGSGKNEAAMSQRLEALQSSNKLYEENNRKLGDELAKIRAVLSSKERECVQAKAQLEKLQDVSKTNDLMAKTIAILQREKDLLTDEKASLIKGNSELTKLKKSSDEMVKSLMGEVKMLEAIVENIKKPKPKRKTKKTT